MTRTDCKNVREVANEVLTKAFNKMGFKFNGVGHMGFDNGSLSFKVEVFNSDDSFAEKINNELMGTGFKYGEEVTVRGLSGSCKVVGIKRSGSLLVEDEMGNRYKINATRLNEIKKVAEIKG